MSILHAPRVTTSAASASSGDIRHLLRRAGFAPTVEEVSAAAAIGYRGTVERLLDPGPLDPDEDLLVHRHLPATAAPHEAAMAAPLWGWHLVTTTTPLREKLALLWHDVFATAYKAGIVGIDQAAQITMLRQHGSGAFGDLLTRLSQDPAMLVWLDNASSTARTPNENYGRELLELFAMGVGSYGEDDVRAAARAFTGWSVRPGPSPFLLGPHPMWFAYEAADHDPTAGPFLSAPGPLDGHEVIAEILTHPATARHVAGRLHAAFVADDRDEEAIEDLAGVFVRTGGDITAVMRHLLLSDAFLDHGSRRAKVKTPIELVVGLARSTATWTVPDRRLADLLDAAALMGQTLLAPPNVGGWPSGTGWLQGANLLERVNHAGRVVATSARLARTVLQLTAGDGDPALVAGACLQALDVQDLSPASADALLEAAGEVASTGDATSQIPRTLRLVTALPEFQYC